jgi:hypothetical protein
MKSEYIALSYGSVKLRESIFKQRAELNREYMIGLSCKNLLQIQMVKIALLHSNAFIRDGK